MIIYNGINSFTAFDLYVASRELPAPKRKEIVETVPYMSGEWDFSYHDGNIDEYETLKIKYTFDVIADTKQELHEQRKKLLAWAHSRGDQKLIDTEVSETQYYEVYKAQGEWQGNDLQGLLTVEFSCYPFAKTDKRVSQTLSNTAKTMTVENEGREVVPVISVASKNLFNINEAYAGTANPLTIDGDKMIFGYEGRTNDFFAVACWVDVVPNTDYFASIASYKSIYSLYIYSDKLYGNVVAQVSPNSSFNSGNNTKLLVGIYTLYKLRDASTTTETISQVQIEKGTTPTEYTPYVEATATIKHGSNSLTLGAGMHKNRLTLEAGENTFTVNGTGELAFEFAEESY